MSVNNSLKARVHIANLDPQVSRELVHELFLPFGQIVDVFLPVDTKGKPRGFADVQYEEEDDALAAIDNMEGSELFNRTLHVRQAIKEGPQLNSSRPVWEQEEFLEEQQTKTLQTEEEDE